LGDLVVERRHRCISGRLVSAVGVEQAAAFFDEELPYLVSEHLPLIAEIGDHGVVPLGLGVRGADSLGDLGEHRAIVLERDDGAWFGAFAPKALPIDL
jgi:hypothetical protein